MGTITPRKRSDGSVGYTAQIVRKKGKEFLHREAKTFDRKREAEAWLRHREGELDKPGALATIKPPSTKLGDAIDKYVEKSVKEIKKTKSQVLRSIKSYEIAAMDCAAIRAEHVTAFAQELLDGGRHPSTVGNYVSHLAAVFAVARPAWGYQLDQQAMRNAQAALSRLGIIAPSSRRTRRPTLAELDLLLQHFIDVQKRRPKSNPMARIVAFAIFSTRRMEEITRIAWEDLDEEHSRILVRNMKNPGQTVGNDVWCELPPEALRIVKAMPRSKPQIFPYSIDAIGMAFTRACDFLGIDDLRFHDLRHEGVSRLFEMGRTIPLAASVSGHKSWQSLQRYSHVKVTGDKFANWRWLDIIAPTIAPE